MSAWDWLDWVLATLILASVAAAALKGFVRELIGLASLVAGLAVAATGYRWAAAWFEDLTRSHQVALAAGFVTLFIAVLIAGAIVEVLAKKALKATGLVWFDRLLGAAFGLARGVGIACVLLMVMMAFGIKTEALQASVLAPYVATLTRPLAAVMPEDLRRQFQDGLSKFRQALAQQEKKTAK